jgi:hypothetical protein
MIEEKRGEMKGMKKKITWEKRRSGGTTFKRHQ